MGESDNLLAPSEQHSTCACGCEVSPGAPELDVRGIPHRLRHATVHGALEAVLPGGSMILVAPHDPKPLLAEIAQRQPGAIEVVYLDEGPDVWRLRLRRN